jgi:hypothetical protein
VMPKASNGINHNDMNGNNDMNGMSRQMSNLMTAQFQPHTHTHGSNDRQINSRSNHRQSGSNQMEFQNQNNSYNVNDNQMQMQQFQYTAQTQGQIQSLVNQALCTKPVSDQRSPGPHSLSPNITGKSDKVSNCNGSIHNNSSAPNNCNNSSTNGANGVSRSCRIHPGENHPCKRIMSSMSIGLKNLVSSLLRVEGKNRITANELAQNDWVLGNAMDLGEKQSETDAVYEDLQKVVAAYQKDRADKDAERVKDECNKEIQNTEAEDYEIIPDYSAKKFNQSGIEENCNFKNGSGNGNNDGKILETVVGDFEDSVWKRFCEFGGIDSKDYSNDLMLLKDRFGNDVERPKDSESINIVGKDSDCQRCFNHVPEICEHFFTSELCKQQNLGLLKEQEKKREEALEKQRLEEERLEEERLAEVAEQERLEKQRIAELAEKEKIEQEQGEWSLRQSVTGYLWGNNN